MKSILFSILFIYLAEKSFAQTTYTWNQVGNGSWATTTNWTPARTTPAANDILVINNGGTKTISNVPTQTIGQLIIGGNTTINLTSAGGDRTATISGGTGTDLDIQSGSTLQIGGTDGNRTRIAFSGAQTAAITGIVTITDNTNDDNGIIFTNSTTTVSGVLRNNHGVITSTTANLIFSSTGIYRHGFTNTAGTIPTATWNSGSTCEVAAYTSNTATPGGLAQSFHHFTWNCPSQTGSIGLAGNLTAVAGDLIITTTNTAQLRLTANPSFTLNIGGNLSLSNGNLVFSNGDNAAVTINVAGNFSQGGGTVDYFSTTGGGSTLNTMILNVSGNFTQTAGNFDMASGETNVVRGTQLNVRGNFSQTGSSILTTSTADQDIINGTITFSKTGTQTVTASTPGNITFINFVTATGSILQLNSNLLLDRNNTANWRGNFTVNAGGTVNASTFVVGSQGTGTNALFTLSAGAKIITANATGVQGSINTTNLTASFSSDADYEFQGTATGAFTTTPVAATGRDFIVNNTTGNIILSQPMTVTRNLSLTNGLLTTTTNLLTISATGSSSAAINSSYINGPLAKTGNTSFIFPVGKSGTGFRNIGISAPTASSTFTAEFFRADPKTTVGTSLGSGITQISACEYWTLNRTGTGDARVILSWESGSPCNAEPYVTQPITLRVTRWTGSTWTDEGRQSSTGSASAGTITSGNSITAFSPFALGSSASDDNPLPIRLGNLKGYEKLTGIQIDWTNFTEEKVDHYQVERCANGRDFSPIGIMNASKNNGGRSDYGFYDGAPLHGIGFYRIKVLEENGNIVYSIIIRVNTGGGKPDAMIYPNPVRNGHDLSYQLNNLSSDLYTIRVRNVSGQEIYFRSITVNGGSVTESVPTVGFNPGLYQLQIISNNNKKQIYKSFIVQ